MRSAAAALIAAIPSVTTADGTWAVWQSPSFGPSAAPHPLQIGQRCTGQERTGVVSTVDPLREMSSRPPVRDRVKCRVRPVDRRQIGAGYTEREAGLSGL
jgi:hypothetical protein